MKLFLICCCCFFSFSVYSSDNVVYDLNIHGSQWKVVKHDGNYSISLHNSNGEYLSNNDIIPSELSPAEFSITHEDSLLFLSLFYPRDAYQFGFTPSNGELQVACKNIELVPSSEDDLDARMILCQNKLSAKKNNLSNINFETVLDPSDLYLKERVKAAITAEKAFLFSKEKKPLPRKPYLIKGDAITIFDYTSSWIGVEYKGKSEVKKAWVKIKDVL